MYTYVFENKEYEVALNNVKAILFDIVTKEEEKLTEISAKAINSGDNNLQQSFSNLRSQEDDCLRQVLSISNQLAENLKKLDSYSRELKHIEDKNIADIIASITVSNNNSNVRDIGNYTSGEINMPTMSMSNNNSVVTSDNNFNNNPELQYAAEMAAKSSNNVSEEVMPYDDGISTVVEEVVDYVPEEVETQPGTSGVVEEVMPYDDGISTIVEEVVDYVPEDAGPQTASGEAVEEVMPYDDEISTISAEGEASPATGEVVEEVMPYDDEISTISAEGEASPATGEAVEEVMPYDDEISTISAEGEASPVAEEAVEEVMPYDDEISTISAEGEASPATGEAVEEVMPYDDEISTISAEGEASQVAEEAVEASDSNTLENNSAVKLVIPSVSVNTSDSNKEPEVVNEEVSSGPLIIPTIENSSSVENKESNTASTLVIPSVTNMNNGQEVSNESITEDAQEETTIDPLLEAALKEDKSKSSESNVIQLTFKKRSNELAKAILTSGKQNANLRKSLETQEALLKSRGFFDNLISINGSDNLEQQLVNNGLLPEDINSQIEKMMAEANTLYSSGKIEEAQAMYNKISELNKQVNGSELKAA